MGFLAIHPFMSMYYKYLGMQQADKPSEKELIEFLVFNKDDILNGKVNFGWIDSREFEYNGDMYDIVKKEENDKQIFLYCINDSKEEKLDKEFSKNVEETTTNKKQKPNDNNPIKTLISEAVCLVSSKLMDADNLAYMPNYFRTYSSIWKEIATPPPKNYS
jgi:hypothetical protein